MIPYNKFFASLILLALLPGCRKQERENPLPPANISVGGIEDRTITVGALDCGENIFTVQSNRDWEITKCPDWAGVFPSSGSSGEFCEVALVAKTFNYSSQPRTGMVSISAGDKTVEISLLQKAYNPSDYGFDDISASLDGHPRLLAEGKEFPLILNAAVSSPEFKVIHDYILHYADKVLSLPPVVYKLEGVRLLNVSCEALKRLFYLSYAYRTTGNPVYAARASKEVETVCVTFPDWHPDHFLDTAEMMLAVAVAYDWCYPRLSAEVRSLAEETIRTRGIQNYFEKWSGATNNWNQVCNGAACCAAFVLDDKYSELKDAVYSRALEMIGTAMVGYEPDGAYLEGPGYWCYGTSYNTLFLDVVKKAFGDYRDLPERYPAFFKTTSYADAVITPSFNVFTYSDQAFPAQVSIVPFFMFDYNSDASVLYLTRRMLRMNMLSLEHCRHERLLPSALVFLGRRGLVTAEALAPEKTSYIAQGRSALAVFRENWDERSASYIGMKCGSPSSTGHSHMDVGTFCFESNGVQWATDLGGEVYNNLEKAGVDLWNMSQGSERWTVLRCALYGHNCLLFDGAEQKVGAYAQVDEFNEDDPSYRYAGSSLAALYAGQVDSVHRTVALVDRRNGRVKDFVKTGEKSVLMRWNMCSAAVAVTLDRNGADLMSRDGHRLRLDVTSEVPFTMKTWSSAPSRECEAENKAIIIGFECRLAANSEYEFKVDLLNE